MRIWYNNRIYLIRSKKSRHSFSSYRIEIKILHIRVSYVVSLKNLKKFPFSRKREGQKPGKCVFTFCKITWLVAYSRYFQFHIPSGTLRPYDKKGLIKKIPGQNTIDRYMASLVIQHIDSTNWILFQRKIERPAKSSSMPLPLLLPPAIAIHWFYLDFYFHGHVT